MRYLCVLLLAGLAFTGCKTSDASSSSNAAAPPVANQTTSAPVPNDGARRIPIEEARAAVAKGEAIIVDARDANAYKSSHITGAINIYAPEAVNHIADLPKDKLVIFYCS
jgi:3-mercaptopyruvate sulfurtransferase SseA